MNQWLEGSQDKIVESRERQHSKSISGAVLIVVLWILLATSMLALSFAASVRTEVNAARNMIEQKKSYYLSRAGIEYAIYKVIESQQIWLPNQRIQQGQLEALAPDLNGTVALRMSTGTVQVKIGDETGKINVNLAPSHLIYNLLVLVGLDQPKADVITDSIGDWRDADNLYRSNGAESDYYQSLEVPYLAKNGVFDVPEELLLVRGITPEVYFGRKGLTDVGERVEYYGLQKYFTTFTTINRINVNSAPLAVLASISELDYESASRIDVLRQGRPFQNITEIFEAIPGVSTNLASVLSTNRSNIYSLVSDGRVTGAEAVNRIRCVIRINPTAPKGYSVLYWNESNLEL